MDDLVQPLHGAHDLQIARETHAQAHVDVAHLQSRRQAVTGDVGDREAENLVGDRNQIVEVAADRLHRLDLAVEIEIAVDRHAPGQDRRLDLARLVEDLGHAVLAQLLVDRVAQHAERKEHVVVVGARIDVEGEQELLVAELDRGEALDAELALELLVDARIPGVHVHDPLGERDLDRRVTRRHAQPALDRLGVRKGRDHFVGVVAPAVEAAAADAQRVLETADHRAGEGVDGRAGVARGLDLAHDLLDLLHQLPVVDRRRVGCAQISGLLVSSARPRRRQPRSIRARTMRSWAATAADVLRTSLQRMENA